MLVLLANPAVISAGHVSPFAAQPHVPCVVVSSYASAIVMVFVNASPGVTAYVLSGGPTLITGVVVIASTVWDQLLESREAEMVYD